MTVASNGPKFGYYPAVLPFPLPWPRRCWSAASSRPNGTTRRGRLRRLNWGVRSRCAGNWRGRHGGT